MEARACRGLIALAGVAALIGLAGCGGSRAGGQGVVVIGHGQTAAGNAFVATAYRGERPLPAFLRPHGVESMRGPASGCSASVQIEQGHESSNGGVGNTICLAHLGGASDPSVTCNAGLLMVTSYTARRTRRVRMTLSNGATLTSAAMIVPPAIANAPGIYFQVVRGPSPIPVSLTELDSRGRTVRASRLPAITECTRNPLKYLPGGKRSLLADRVPRGPAFSIVGERYRFLGKTYFDLAAEIKGHGEQGGARDGGGGGSFSPQESPGVLAWSTQEGCSAHPYVQWAIVYGLLRNPHDRVIASIAKRGYRLKAVPIPASLHPGGKLVYAVLPRRPTGLLVLTPSGKTASRETLGLPAPEHCEPGESSGIAMIGG